MSGTRVGLFCGYLDPTRDGVADYTRQESSWCCSCSHASGQIHAVHRLVGRCCFGRHTT